ncbi:hypothetical protein TorRG33x02_261460 [Trema orientale]|uniref:Uncharacterized protein n=1 Tax=Trema orientale TaxID=63057 RepID=A0A2P5D5Y6_TREOI|nr:hypothetical protein TorRG33x02_261460 [Trema orientale]
MLLSSHFCQDLNFRLLGRNVYVSIEQEKLTGYT